TVLNATLKGEWSEKDGGYTATYTANQAGTGLQATLTLGAASASSVAYAITAGAVSAATVVVDQDSYVS
ncbi:hypothetical protein, partial [Serratia marcescens]|uniref:hypothetical protein n=1 Tax=Serratia marcescens TaxID=615 RepID=UPI0027E421DD